MVKLNSGKHPVLPIRHTVIFPGTAIPLRVARAKSVAAARQAQADGSQVLLLAQKKETLRGQDPASADLYSVGTLCEIEKMRGSEKEGFQVVVRGVKRVRVYELKDVSMGSGSYLEALCEDHADLHDADSKTEEVLLDGLKKMGTGILELIPGNTQQLAEVIDGINDLVLLTHLCSANIEMPVEKRQELLETVSLKARALKLMEHLEKLRDSLEVQNKIREKLDHKMGKAQREAILREQLKAIREELGDKDDESRSQDYRKKIEDAGMPEETRTLALEELERLESIGPSAPEAHVIKNYLDLLCAMPWNKSASSDIDLEQARETLDRDHYGLSRIKKRILQHLAVMKLKKSGRGSILLFVGPPGVGKTSLGASIAKALGRKFVRASLGGVRDDAEIRGHRRTYIGAMPGRIIQSIKRAGENNPVMMLDEIDKLAMGYHGDPAAALLEVLDPEQNATFMDHYLDVPFDLSKVFFIATANTLETIPGPLLDRMEVIDLSGYTTAEKLHIARNHLIPKQLAEHGLTAEQVTISDEALLWIINSHTREAGVRELQRKIAAVCRATTEKVLAPEAKLPIRIEGAELDEILGPERFVHEVANLVAPAGVVTGLAWTPLGGEILFIETGLMPGNGKLIITGQLGEVMRESAQIAQSLVRSKLSALVPVVEHDRKDLHIHVPAGAIPKDGPSAGVAITLALASLYTDRRVDPALAMTGEVTLRGAVMPVGGIKEKVMAAHRAGIKRVILPKRNQKDLREVPEEVRSALRFDFVDEISEAIRIALGIDATSTTLPPGSGGQNARVNAVA